MKDFLKRWLFSSEIRDLELRATLLKNKELDFEAYKKSLTVTDLVREQLKGFDPRLLDDESDLLDIQGEDERNAFLSKAHDLFENAVLRRILAYLTRNQILFTAKEGRTLEEDNFGRATINGYSLLEEELERLEAVYKKEHEEPEEYDEHAVT